MIGFIKKIFSGILSFLVGLFGGKKSEAALAKPRKRSGYFMELDESEETSSAKTPELVTAAKEATKQIQAKTSELVDAAKGATKQAQAKTSDVVDAAKGATKQVQAKTSDVVDAAKGATKQAQEPKTSAQPVATAAKPEQPKTSAQPTVELVQTAQGLKAEIAKPAATASTNGQNKTETTFAPKYLIPTNSNTRRRPGANMSSFLDMANQVKTAR